MRSRILELLRSHSFDCLVCDFPNVAANIADLGPWVLFQHNVETMIWRRHAENASDPLRRWYLGLQAKRMFAYERKVCRGAAHIIAVSDVDARAMREMFGAGNVSEIPTGVDVEGFAAPAGIEPAHDLVFVGSMDWLANIDGVQYFVREVLPLIRRRRPGCSLVIAGRRPTPGIVALSRADPLITVTGTVADIRPYIWKARVSIVPLRVGGGTRLKIYESMAAKVPVVSTSIGAEGLAVTHPDRIRLADTAQAFADHCLELLEDAAERRRMAACAWETVATRFSWEQVARCFEKILESACVRSSRP